MRLPKTRSFLPSRAVLVLTLVGALTVTCALPLAADGGDDADRILFGLAHLGPTSPNTLYALDPETGAATAVGSTGSNGTSIVRISAMALSDDGVMYAVGWRPDAPDGETETHVLVTLDLENGAATVVGPTGLEGFVGVFPRRMVMSDLTFSECGELFAYTFPGGGLATIDLGTGAATQRIAPGFPGTGFHNGGGLDFASDGVLYHGGDSGEMPGQGSAALQALDPETSEVLFEIPLLFPVGFGSDPRPNTMDFEPGTGVLHSLFKANFMEQATYFGILDPVTGVATVIGPTANGMAALAWGPEAPRPPGPPPHTGPPPKPGPPPGGGPPPHCD
jgi:hypothetical protein